MDLNDVLYIIKGSLEVTKLVATGPDGEPIYEAVLYDNIHDPCMLRGEGLEPEPDSPWKYATARAQACTEREAVEALAKRIAGNSLGHDWPIMWKSYTEWLRMPPTLVAGTPTISEPRREKPVPTEAIASS